MRKKGENVKKIQLMKIAAFIMVAILCSIVTLKAAISTSAPNSIGKYEVFEITITHDESPYTNVWEDVIPVVVFHLPSGNDVTVEGFYYDTDTWKVRFAPWELGNYTWDLTMGTDSDNGSFNCQNSTKKGFIRQHPSNPYRFIYEGDSSLFNGFGWGNGVGPNPLDPDEMIGDNSVQGWWSTETDTNDINWFLAELGGHDLNEYLDSMVGVGKLNFNRWSAANGGWAPWDVVAPGGNTYNVIKGKWGDDYVKALRNRGVRILFDPIGFGWQDHPGFSYQAIDLQDRDAVKRYYSYIIARWGAYVDFYELFNEYVNSDDWITEMANHIKSVDPYGKMVSISWARPDHAAIDINCPHVYFSSNLQTVDLSIKDVVDNGWSVEGPYPKNNYAKPLIFGEAGENFGNLSENPQRPYYNRVKAWTAFFLEAHTLFWEQNWNHLYGGGIYFGTQTRKYFGAHQTYAGQVSADVNITSTSSVSGGASGSRVYELSTSDDLYLYIFCPTSQQTPPITNDVTADITVPKAGTAYWYSTTDGSIMQSFPVTAGDTSIDAPAFQLDIALMVKGDTGPADTTSPGKPTGLDSVSTSANTVELTWNASSDNTGVTSYNIYKDGVLETSTSNTSIVISGLSANTAYDFSVSARDAAGNESLQSDAFSVTTKQLVLYTLVVNSGSGDGDYQQGTIISVQSDPAHQDSIFDKWTGDTQHLSNIYSSATNFTMPGSDASITAIYKYKSAPDITSGMEAYLPFDETSGATAPDATGNGNNGTLINNPQWVAGILNNGLQFDGTDDYVELANENNFDYSTSFSISLWAKKNPSTGFMRLINKPGSNFWESPFFLSATNSDEIETGFEPGEYYISSGGLDDGVFHHLVLVWDSQASELYFYYDSVLDGLITTTHTPGLNDNNVIIGAGSPTDEHFNGIIDEVRIYSRVLSPVDVKALYENISTYQLTVHRGSGDGNYQQGTVIPIQADPALQDSVFDQWTGDTAYLASVTDSSTTVTMPSAPVSITATYKDAPSPTYTLTVNSGTGGGDYTSGTVVDVAADAGPTGQVFDQWTGDTAYLASVTDSSTTATMPSAAVSITATYKDITGCTTPVIPQICIVGVDNNTHHNVIAWDNAISDVDSIRVYVETDQANDYVLAGNAVAGAGMFEDTLSDPTKQAYRYKISAVNVCGDESGLSELHKTIHLTANKGVGDAWNLIWDGYVGFNVDTYRVYRGTDINNMAEITTIAGNLSSFTDNEAPAGDVFYQIEAINPTNCGSKKSFSTLSTVSNIVQIENVTSAVDIDKSLDFNIYPVPADDVVYIACTKSIAKIEVLNIYGQVIKYAKVNDDIVKLDVTDLDSGVYIIQGYLENKNTVTGRIVVN